MNGDIALRAARSVAEARATAAHLCLDQALGGDSAYTLFACADLGEVLHHLGDRGYRVPRLRCASRWDGCSWQPLRSGTEQPA